MTTLDGFFSKLRSSENRGDFNDESLSRLWQFSDLADRTQTALLRLARRIQIDVWNFAAQNHDTFPCECDRKATAKHRCNKSGFVRCNRRLAAIADESHKRLAKILRTTDKTTDPK